MLAYTTKEPQTDYIPTVFDNYYTDVDIDGKKVSISLWDTAGQEEYARLRPLSYVNTDVFLVCFSVMHPERFENVRTTWYPELSHHCPNAPVILVGTDIDRRDCPDNDEGKKEEEEEKKTYETSSREQEPITYEQGLEMAKSIRALEYVECSTITLENVNRVFDDAMRVAVYGKDCLKGRSNE